jgi:anthranilate phosphoribosyltransferase
MIREATEKILTQKNLSPEEMEAVMEEIMTAQAETSEVVSFLNALADKRETVEELTAAVRVMRRHMTKINVAEEIVLDTCGTGGDKKGTFNISTAVAFVVSGSGITVAKHGNRSVSSCSGSADILEALGVNIRMPKEKIEQCLKEIGIAFLFAQDLHPAMKHAAAARKAIGRRTIFNLLGPLSNPAGVKHQLIGVFSAEWVEPLAQVLANLGTLHALVVYGRDGLDEITTTASTLVAEVKEGRIHCYEIWPEDFNLRRAELSELAGKDISANAEIFLKILKGAEQGPKKDIVLLNAAAAIYVADKAMTIKEGIELAQAAIDSGKALEKFALLKAYSH